jgi:hypothetical protein
MRHRKQTVINSQAWVAIVAVAVLVVAGLWFGLLWKASINRPPTPGSACGIHCGTERWAVKAISDEEATCVDFTPKHTTVSWLVSQPVPERLPEQSRSGNIECQVWELTGQLVEFKAEDDGDFHIVLADLEKPALTMIVEIPDPNCAGVCDSPHSAEMVRARESFTQVFGLPPKRFQRMTQAVAVTVTGVGFFDFKHRQTGLAPNGVELHPVISFKVGDTPQP